jgi:hypothetical protein
MLSSQAPYWALHSSSEEPQRTSRIRCILYNCRELQPAICYCSPLSETTIGHWHIVIVKIVS